MSSDAHADTSAPCVGDHTQPARLGWRTALGLGAIVLAVALPYITKPVHMDGPVTIAMARHILAHPLDPLGYRINWDGRVHRGYELNNPPLTGYLLALGIAVAGVSEVSLHATETVMVALGAVSILGLARRWCRHPWAVVLLVLVSPAFLPSQNVMFDVTLLALWVAALWAWVEGIERDAPALWWLGALLTGLAIHTKYSALVLVPLLVVYVLLRRRYRALWGLVLVAGIVGIWTVHNVVLYDGPHMFSRPTPGSMLAPAPSRMLSTLKALGGITLVGLVCPLLLGGVRRRWGLVAGVAVMVAAPLGVLWVTWTMLRQHPSFVERMQTFAAAGLGDYVTNLAVTLSVMTVLGTLAVAGTLVGSVRSMRDPGRRPVDLFLWAWFLGAVGFSILFSPFTAIRNLLPALVPLVLLFLRAWEVALGDDRARRGMTLTVLIVLTAVLGYAVAEGDRGTARAYQREANLLAELRPKDRGRTWFVGYWGWQWYATQAGFGDLHRGTVHQVRPGDVIVVPLGIHHDPTYTRFPRLPLAQHPVRLGWWPVRTVSNYYRIGFYRTELDDVPYVFAGLDAAPIVVYRVMPRSAGGTP